MNLLSIIASRLIIIVAVLPIVMIVAFLAAVIVLAMPEGDRVLGRIVNRFLQ